MPGEVTAEVLEKVARLLGADALHIDKRGYTLWRHSQDRLHSVPMRSGGEWDLIGACLTEAAKMGNAIEMHFYAHKWFAEIYNPADLLSEPLDAKVDSALEAALLAFAQLPESP